MIKIRNSGRDKELDYIQRNTSNKALEWFKRPAYEVKGKKNKGRIKDDNERRD